MTHQAFTVISTDFDNNHTFMDVVQAANSTDAFTLVALQRNGECDLVVCLEGNLCEGQGVAFPGGGTCSCSQWLDDVNAACEAVAAHEYCDTEVYGWTYSPASGTNDGLTRSDDVVELTA